MSSYLFVITLFFLLYSVFNDHDFDNFFRCLGGLKLESLSNVPRSYMQCIVALRFVPATFVAWWAQVDSNHRPRAYQARALTT